MKTSELLIQAKSLIDSPEKWTQQVYARDKDGRTVLVDSEEAVCFCSLGSLRKMGVSDELYHNAVTILNTTARQISDWRMAAVDFNDAHSHKEVMALWDRAIEAAKQEEQQEL